MSLLASQQHKSDPSEHVPVTADAMRGAPVDHAGQAGVQLTKKAISMAKQALEKRGTPHASLRLGVRGGCWSTGALRPH